MVIVFDGLAYGMLLFLMAVGLSITLGLMRFVHLAHGSFAMLGAYAALWLVQRWQWGYGWALLGAFCLAALCGALLEWALYRRLYRAHALRQVLLSIGVVFISVAALTGWFGAGMQTLALPAALQGQWVLAGWPLSRYRLFLLACGLGVWLALWLLLGCTRYGAMVRAAVDNPRVAAGMGIHVQGVFFVTFALGCGLAGLGGALSLGVLAVEPTFALKYLLYFLMVVCVGGAGTITGPLMAALLVGVVDVVGKYYLPEAGAFLIYAFMIAMLLLRPQGLVQRKGWLL